MTTKLPPTDNREPSRNVPIPAQCGMGFSVLAFIIFLCKKIMKRKKKQKKKRKILRDEKLKDIVVEQETLKKIEKTEKERLESMKSTELLLVV